MISHSAFFSMNAFYRVNSSLCPRTTSIWKPFTGGGTLFLAKDHPSRDPDGMFHQINSDKEIFDQSFGTGKDIKWCYFKASVHFEVSWALTTTSAETLAQSVKSRFVSAPQPSLHFMYLIKLSFYARAQYFIEKNMLPWANKQEMWRTSLHRTAIKTKFKAMTFYIFYPLKYGQKK